MFRETRHDQTRRSTTSGTDIEVWGELVHLPALANVAAVPPLQTREVLHGRGRLEPSSEAPNVLKVVILGGSVSAGCGTLSPSLRCDLAGSWARRLQDRLQAALGDAKEVQVALWARRAITADWFSLCLRLRVPSDTQLVALEFMPNTLSPIATRGLAARAAVAVVKTKLATMAVGSWLTRLVMVAPGAEVGTLAARARIA